jgi:hypothetical protein
MNTLRKDYSIFEKFNFEHQPVGMKYLLSDLFSIINLERRQAASAFYQECFTRRRSQFQVLYRPPRRT